ncbi:MAG: succinate dehydrogenase, cytochrome b556 subunit [Chloroflexi bacterium]|nr:succinate dehydrogenase, cytochrome b556 subunit [Chloroflexota bacterium]
MRYSFSERETRMGWWAWAGRRVTGVALVLYLLAHIGVISTALRGQHDFDRVLAVLQSPPFVVADLLLLLAVLYHTLDGLRIILLDLGIGARHQAALIWAVGALTMALTGAATWATWPLIAR